MKKIIIIVVCMFLIFNFPLTQAFNKCNEEETTLMTIDICRLFGSKSISKTVTIGYAQDVYDVIKNYYDDSNNKHYLVDTLFSRFFSETNYELKYLSSVLPDSKQVNSDYMNWNRKISPVSSFSFSNVNGVGSGKLLPSVILKRPRLFLSWKGNSDSITNVGEPNSDKGFTATGQQRGTCLGFIGIGITDKFGSYAFIGYAVNTKVDADVIEQFPINNKPQIIEANPYQNQEYIQLTLSELSFNIFDEDNDLMDIFVETNPDVGSATRYQVSNGTYKVHIKGLSINTWYDWYVNVTDGTHWTRKKYSFYTGGDHMVGYWSFDEGEGNDAFDLSGFNHIGNIKGATWTYGIRNNALYFNGRDTVYIFDKDPLNFHDTRDFCLSFWMKWNGKPSNHDQHIINNFGKYGGYKVVLNKYEQLSFIVGNGWHTFHINSTTIEKNRWYHIDCEMYYDYTPHSFSIYIDGVKVNQSIHLLLVGNDNTKWLEFGCENGFAGGRFGFNGILDEIYIYDDSIYKNYTYQWDD